MLNEWGLGESSACVWCQYVDCYGGNERETRLWTVGRYTGAKERIWDIENVLEECVAFVWEVGCSYWVN